MPLVESLLGEKPFESVVAFRVNFDTQHDFLKAFGVRWQSTLIVFKGKKEVGRSVGDVNKDRIRRLFEKGL